MVTIDMVVNLSNGDQENVTVSDGRMLLRVAMPLLRSEKVDGIYIHSFYEAIKKEEGRL